MLELRNPHSILAVLQRRPKAVKSLRVQSEQPGESWDRVLEAARGAGISVRVGGAEDRRGPRRDTERVGAGAAMVEPPSPLPLEAIFSTESAGFMAGTGSDPGSSESGSVISAGRFFWCERNCADKGSQCGGECDGV